MKAEQLRVGPESGEGFYVMQGKGIVAHVFKPYDPAIVVRAVNSHQALVEACEAANSVLHVILGFAYKYVDEALALECSRCHEYSPINDDGKTFKVKHADGCVIAEAIKAERDTLAALRLAKEGA